MSPARQTPRAGFEALLRPHLDRLYRLAFRLTGNKAEAEDLFQDVLVKAFTGLDKLAGLREPGQWLSRVMFNRFVDGRRAAGRQRLVSVDSGALPGEGVESLPGDLDPARDAEELDNARRVERALARLSDDHRTVVLLHDVEGYKLEEIEAMTGDPVGTLKSRLHRARARLREFLAADGTESAAQACKAVTGWKT